MSATNSFAKELKALHKPGQPLVLANVYDILSAEAVAALPSCKALATASYAVARASGTTDDDMPMETNLHTARAIAHIAQKFGKPLTVDIQDAYGEQLEATIKQLIEAGVSGINLEDCDKETHSMHTPQTAVERIRRVLAVAKSEGVPDFVVNARCDTLVKGGELSEVFTRGKLYLEAGATTVFVWGGSNRGVSRAEVERMVKEFDGRLNVSLRLAAGNLTVKELAEIGVARISVGPQIQFLAMDSFAKAAEKLLKEAL
jgi:2-methylisocitrate lyase-like PEP mutase family enzyme